MTDTTTESELEGIGYAEFRNIMGSFASGISVVTTLDDDNQPCGMTCSAVCSVSADPPLLLACVRTPSSTLDTVRKRGQFAMNFLDSQARDLSDLFASRTPDKFAAVQWSPGDTARMPILDRTLAHAECEVHDLINAGDHVIVLGRLVGGGTDTTRFPLGYWRGSYVRLFRMTATARS
ncbi:MULTISPECIES: flavin reductase family protein [unclassified Streptomyces]|uniref:flavin reductase family protein n=1 Tax=unclassified Streptomyces TaxID=2593676 RepID=UPI002250CB87|nr:MULTISPECIES: flavin reductase family protein [unclassified Streptomyces]WSP53051.1 flavin reductase family protein [Streptomyces sp. NBC_01241]WSU19648.1 flavin reductase family protein [Streptomyces sp. NBC_01108]MCX4800062.1 flavin reductase family protein [Streptomyces sp. NBC_01242]WSJ40750.1 flavin reductase family protein [Streptomyces sp. NBC_01321]WSP59800.1 flavin reductase family protein [Streptomyces sp. NBC_01241]